MKIEFDAKEVEAIILAEAQKYDKKLNHVRIESYGRNAVVTYVEPVETADAKADLCAKLGLPA